MKKKVHCLRVELTNKVTKGQVVVVMRGRFRSEWHCSNICDQVKLFLSLFSLSFVRFNNNKSWPPLLFYWEVCMRTPVCICSVYCCLPYTPPTGRLLLFSRRYNTQPHHIWFVYSLCRSHLNLIIKKNTTKKSSPPKVAQIMSRLLGFKTFFEKKQKTKSG